MEKGSVLISGASIAGPALAYWLHRYGYMVTVVERAPTLLDGGYAVDVRGAAHIDVLTQMGILAEVRRQQTHMGAMDYVDRSGKRMSSMPAEIMSGEVEILRGDLSRILYDVTKDDVEYIFGDSITAMTEGEDGMQVTFTHCPVRTFSLVIGADGLHSNVRSLIFGDEAEFIHNLGYYVAIFTTENHLNLDHTGRFYSVPGKTAGVYSARDNTEAKALFVFAAESLNYDRRDTMQQKVILANAFAGQGWEIPTLLNAMWDAPDFYFDSISQVQMERWSKGRVALLGDAGYGATMGGMGTGLAVVGAYVLAGELAAAGDDYRVAFARYERQLRAYATGCQKFGAGVGPSLAPRSWRQIWSRNQIFRILPYLPWKNVINTMTTKVASDIVLQRYAN